MSFGETTILHGIPEHQQDGTCAHDYNAFLVLLKPTMHPVGYVEASIGDAAYGFAEDIAPEVTELWRISAARDVLCGFLNGQNTAFSPQYVQGPFVLMQVQPREGLLDLDPAE